MYVCVVFFCFFFNIYLVLHYLCFIYVLYVTFDGVLCNTLQVQTESPDNPSRQQ